MSSISLRRQQPTPLLRANRLAGPTHTKIDSMTAREGATLFAADRFWAIELGADDVAQLQRFFDENPEYFVIVTGEAAGPGEASDAIHGALPEGWSFTKKWAIGFVDEAGSMIGMADVVSDLLTQHVWHIGLFIVATRLRGAGVAQLLYSHLEHWTHEHGAQWLRLGVVKGQRASAAVLAAPRLRRCTHAQRASRRARAYHSRDVQAAGGRQPPRIPGARRPRSAGRTVTALKAPEEPRLHRVCRRMEL
jgi:GNAT superfamily N-acetyltransferase